MTDDERRSRLQIAEAKRAPILVEFEHLRSGPRAKIERAKEHLKVFEQEIDAFNAAEPYQIAIVDEADRTRHFVVAKRKPIPSRWGAIVGDILHNARSSLDLLVTCSATNETKEFTEAKFPFREHKADLEKNGLQKLRGCPNTIRFLRRLGPYERLKDADRPNADLGHHANTLVLLNRLNNYDKHRLIVPVGSIAGKALVRPAPGYGEPFEMSPPDLSLMSEGDIILTLSPQDPLFAERKFNIEVTTNICLAYEGLPFIGAASLMAHIVKTVDRVIGIAERKLYA